MKSAHLILVLVLVIAFAGTAQAFEMVVSADTISVHTGETKTIDVAVVSAADDIIVFAPPIEQPWMTVPTHLFVNASQQATSQISFSPFANTEPKLYKLQLSLQSMKTGEKREKNITVSVRSAQVAIEKIDITGTFEPGGWGQLDIFVKNYENSQASAFIDVNAGDFLKFNDSSMLAAGEFKVIKRGFTIPECQASGEYTIRADVQFQGVNVFSADEKFVIPEKFTAIVTKNETRNWFKTETIVTIKNTGNIAGKYDYKENIIGTLFFSGDQPNDTNNGFTWSADLEPCQIKVIRYQIDYTPIPVVIFVVFALWYIFFRMRTVRIRKLILQKATIEKGFEFTVGIDTKSWVNAKDVEIHDFVPSLFEVRDSPGIKPIKRKTDAGTELIWKFNELRTYEERMLDYKIVPLFGISGEVSLPRPTVSFTYLGRRITKSSLPASLGMKMTEHVERAGRISDKFRYAFRRK